MAKIRCSMLIALRRYLQHKYPAAYRTVLAELDPETRAVCESVLVNKDFLEIEIYQRFIVAFQAHSTAEEFAQSAYEMAEGDLRGLFLIFARLLSRQFLLERMTEMWTKMIEGAQIELIEANQTRIGVRVKGLDYCDAYRLHSEVYIRAILERATRAPQRSESRTLGGVTEFWFYGADATVPASDAE